jgi:uncharacterized lipoprotein YajG
MESVAVARQKSKPARSSAAPALLALFTLFLLPSCVQDSVEPLSVPLQYRMMASADELVALPDCAALSAVVVVDAREDSVLGTRVNEGRDAPPVPVTASSDVSEWLRTGVEEALRTNGVSLARSGAPVLRIEIERIRTFENVYRRAGYEARISLSAAIAAQGETDSACWIRQSNGHAENYGYAGTAENYEETLNHALDRALIALFESPGFREAVCERCD